VRAGYHVYGGGRLTLFAVPVTLKEANNFVETYHRHSGRTSRDGGKFAIGVSRAGYGLLGVVIVGRPLARALDDGVTAEALRVCVLPNMGDVTKGACSFLYAAAWRAWRAMGGHKMVTYTLQSESGQSLVGAGAKTVAQLKGRPKGWNRSDGHREFKDIYGQDKFRWEWSTQEVEG